MIKTLLVSMNIASNGKPAPRATLEELRWQLRHQSCSGPEARLAVSRRLWQLSGFDDYQFTLTRRQVGRALEELRIGVRGGQVVSAHRLDPLGLAARPEPLSGPDVGSIDTLFDRMAEQLRREPRVAQTHYDPLYGYPLSLRLSEAVRRPSEQRQLA